jgi:hypothetical protein
MSDEARDWEAGYNRAVADAVSHLDTFIMGEFGERCSTVDEDCPTCKLWKLRDEFLEIVR